MNRISVSIKQNWMPKMGFHSSSSSFGVTRFNLPAMSPTMTEGTIHQWKKKEGESFSVGDVLLELETDKAQIDVEAVEDGVLAKIILQNGSRAPVNTLIALMAEEGDDISSVEIPKEETPAAEKKQEAVTEQPAKAKETSAVNAIHADGLDMSGLKKPLSPAVLSLVLKHGIRQVGLIEASGYGGRILKGDVLAHLGFISPKPAPAPNFTAAPPRDQIVFAKVEKKVLSTHITKRVIANDFFKWHSALAEQKDTCVNDLIAKAAQKALADVNKQAIPGKKSVVYVKSDNRSMGGVFKVFDLAEPEYDFITDSHSRSKPYELSVRGEKRVNKANESREETMMDLIAYLGGSTEKTEGRAIDLRQASEPRKEREELGLVFKLDGGVRGEIKKDKKVLAFLEGIEHYVRCPQELV